MNLKSRSTGARIATVLIGLVALLLLSGCGSDDKKPTTAATGAVKLSGTIDLTVEKNGFNKDSVTAKPGTIKITVIVPDSATGKHGVGIDGGQFNNIPGAAVAPGRSTSLTVTVKKGPYTIFDSYKNNREKGYTAKLTVK